MRLHELPEEILDLCCRFADKPTLRALRLSSQKWRPSATKRLFQHIELLPTEVSAARCQRILESSLNSSVSSVRFHTSDLATADVRDGTIHPPEAELPDTFKEVLDEVGRFKNLQYVSIKFSMDCAAPQRGARLRMTRQVRETQTFRNSVLDWLIGALAHEDHPARKVRRLSIKNLQDVVAESTATSPQFKTVLEQLNSLSLQIATEYDPAGPEVNISLAEVHNCFNTCLKQYWLQPVQSHLVQLKLYATEMPWGYFPACDLRDLHMPKLRSLALGLMTFTHDWQLDWILSHSATLESLTLDDCPIVHACFMYVHFDQERSSPTRAQYRAFEGESSWTYDTRWHHYLNRIREGLPHLSRFSFGVGPWKQNVAFESSKHLAAELRQERYCIYDGTVAPTSWVTDVIERNGQRYYGCAWEGAPAYPECDREDQDALDDLLMTIKNRR